jgi:hypothetical protein
MRLIKDGLDPPACQCRSEGYTTEEEETTTSWYRPELDLDYLVMSSTENTMADTDPFQEIDIHYMEVLKMLAHLQNRAKLLAPHKEYLRYVIRCDYPGHEEKATLVAVDHIFRITRLYFHRTLRSPGHRLTNIHQLRRELNVYLWTLLAEWVEAYCDDATRNQVLEQGGPDCVTKANFGAPAAVLKFWRECVEDTLELLVWRDEEVRWCRVQSGVVLGILTILFLWVLLITFCGNIGSHT